ncbi:MAG: DUF748 domain-containing protein [Pseudomonadales bacterium]|nr:DUF748 domain-containing protein [Pseudomonadales bacterium]
MTLSSVWSAMTGWQRSLLIASLSLGLYALLGFFLLPHVLQKQLVEQLTPMTERAVSVGEVKFNPFLLTLSIKDFSIESKESDQPLKLIQWQELFIDFEASSLFHLAWTFKEIRWSQPHVYVGLLENGRFSFDDILDRVLGTNEEAVELSSAEETEDYIPSVRITKFILSDAAIRVKDKSREGDNLLDLSPISFSLNRFSTEVDTKEDNGYGLRLVGKKGGSLEWDGALTLRPMSSKGRLKLTNIDLAQFVEFYKEQLGFDVPVALLSFETDYEIFQEPEWGVQLSNGHYRLRDFKLIDEQSQATLIDMPELDISGVAVNSVKQQALIEKISIKKTALALTQYKDGTLSIDHALDFSAFESAEDPSKLALAEEGVEAKAQAAADTDATDWYWKVDTLAIESMAVDFEDRSPATPVKLAISDVNILLENVHSDSREDVSLSLDSLLNESAHLSVTAEGTLTPLALQGDVTLEKMGLVFAQPYIEDSLSASISKGSLSTAMHYELKENQGDTASEQPFSVMHVSGDLSIDNFSLRDDIRRKRAVSWRSLSLKELDLDLVENVLSIDVLTMYKPYIRAEMLKDGSINLQNLIVEGKATSQTKADNVSKAEEKPFAVKIKKNVIKNGKIYFADRTLSPNYVTSLDHIYGYVTGVSTIPGRASRVHLKAKVDGHAPVEIKGRSNFMIDQPTLDMDIMFKGIEMTSFTPYSSTYAGYKVKQGQITLTLDYTLANNNLLGKNNIHINQFDFGEKVESEQATRLPVKLAVALLEDKNNQINLDLDIEGDVNDPDFSVKGLVWKVFSNIIVKAVSSPFSLLAGLAGSDDELNIVEFSAGESVLDEDSADKLQTLANALHDRPKLTLAVRGMVNRAEDYNALAERHANQQVLEYLQKSGRKASADGQLYAHPLPLADKHVKRGFERLFEVQVSDERSSLIEETLKADKEGLTKDALEQQKFVSYYQALIEAQRIEGQALTDLAHERALMVKNTLVSVNGIAAERIFIQQTEQDGEDLSQVLLTLQ